MLSKEYNTIQFGAVFFYRKIIDGVIGCNNKLIIITALHDMIQQKIVPVNKLLLKKW